MNLETRIKNQLAEIESKGLKRKLASPRGIDFSSNDYLDLANDERIKNALINAIKREGVGSTGSRLLRGERDCFREVETHFAKWKGTENSLYFATGYQANVGLMQTFLENDDVVFSDELNHASLIDGIRLAKCEKKIFNHFDYKQVEKLLNETECKGQKFLVTESLFSMDGDIAPLQKYAESCRKTNTNLIVDEAHAVGLYGKRGSGLIEQFGIENDVFLSINTAGKALGVSGAFVAGSNLAIEYLINKCRSFIFSTAPIPAIANALKVATEIIETEPERRKKLHTLNQTFCNLLLDYDFEAPSDETQIIPIIIGDSEKAVRIAETMQAKGFDVRAIRPPTVAEGTSRLRITLNLSLSEEILKEFVETLRTNL
ncbi:MAG: 8-amino-7-oxononanoate synthase [Acidobacteriota bacterium]|jgi:8-amino-7-oxononanoate synthase|nr:8-amino-7-oxononanoate synthase [Acidobacteriota bacterium]